MIELQGQIDKSTIIIKDFIISLSVIDRSSIQNIIKDIVELNSIINQIDLIDIYEKLHPAAAEYRFF